MTETMKAWQCIGVCQDRKVELVYAQEYEDALALARRARRHAQALEGLVRRLSWTTPRDGKWEDSYRSLQDQARRLLAVLESDDGQPECA
jgi:hypothetical protein